MRVLNVGGGAKGSPMPPMYERWDKVWLDLNPTCQPDLLMDARDLGTLEPEQFDAVFSSHLLEHIYPHDLRAVLHGIRHVLKASGFMDTIVPNIGRLFQLVAERGLDLDSNVYDSPAGPIAVRDMLWGYSPIQAYSQTPEIHVHKNGFSARTLANILINGDFVSVFQVTDDINLRVIAFKSAADRARLVELGLVLSDD